MLVADIAMRSLTQKTLVATNDLISVVNQWYPKTPDFVQAACWADDLKSDVRTSCDAPTLCSRAQVLSLVVHTQIAESIIAI